MSEMSEISKMIENFKMVKKREYYLDTLIVLSETKADVKTRNKIIDIVNNCEYYYDDEYIAPENKNTLYNWLKRQHKKNIIHNP
jgi:hypothetical protein